MSWHTTTTYTLEQIQLQTGQVTKKQLAAKHKKWRTYWSNRTRQHNQPRKNFLGGWYTSYDSFDPWRYVNKWYNYDTYEYYVALMSHRNK